MKDLEIIKKIENELDVKLEYLGKLNWNSRGYALNKYNRVSGLGLFDCNIKDLKRIISYIKDLKEIDSLNLRNNALSEASHIINIKKLNHLDLSYNKLNDVSYLKNIKTLTYLSLRENNLNDLSCLKTLKKLTFLDLGVNNIIDVSFIKYLKKLTYINLAENQIKEIPYWLLKKNLEIIVVDGLSASECIDLSGNPIKIPPYNIIIKGNEAIRDHFESIRCKKSWVMGPKSSIVKTLIIPIATIIAALITALISN